MARQIICCLLFNIHAYNKSHFMVFYTHLGTGVSLNLTVTPPGPGSFFCFFELFSFPHHLRVLQGFITFFHSKDEFASHRRSINPLAANAVTEAKGDFAIGHQRGARWSPGKLPAGDILHMKQRQDSLLPPAIRHSLFPECFPSFGCSSVRFRACQGWAPLDYCAKTQTGHCSQVKLELEESVYTLKTVPLFSLAGAVNKTSLLFGLLCPPSPFITTF